MASGVFFVTMKAIEKQLAVRPVHFMRSAFDSYLKLVLLSRLSALSRKLHISLILLSLCGGSLYAGEVASVSNARSAPVDLADSLTKASFRALQFEIDFVDAALVRFWPGKLIKAENTGPVPSAVSESEHELAADFWRRMDSLSGGSFELLEVEYRIMNGGSALSNQERGEIRCAGPLRDLRHAASVTERSAMHRAGPGFVSGFASVDRLAPRVSHDIAARPGIGRDIDVRANLHLHSIRNGAISGRPATQSNFSPGSPLSLRIFFKPLPAAFSFQSFIPSLSPVSFASVASVASVASDTAVEARVFGYFLRFRPTRAAFVVFDSFAAMTCGTGDAIASPQSALVPGRRQSPPELIGVSP
ncbi:MAG: hypothetical protein NXI24_13130 [bacterium]|nr:hypothetical protein [bacterium]